MFSLALGVFGFVAAEKPDLNRIMDVVGWAWVTRRRLILRNPAEPAHVAVRISCCETQSLLEVCST
jgi:hypothetical protein